MTTPYAIRQGHPQRLWAPLCHLPLRMPLHTASLQCVLLIGGAGPDRLVFADLLVTSLAGAHKTTLRFRSHLYRSFVLCSALAQASRCTTPRGEELDAFPLAVLSFSTRKSLPYCAHTDLG